MWQGFKLAFAAWLGWALAPFLFVFAIVFICIAVACINVFIVEPFQKWRARRAKAPQAPKSVLPRGE